MTIIGLMTATITLSMSPDTHRQMHDEAYRFARVLEQAIDAAEMGDPLGLLWSPKGYGFRRLDLRGKWQATGESFFADHAWPEGIQAKPLLNAGRPLLLWEHGQSHTLVLTLTHNEHTITLHLNPLGRVALSSGES